MTRFPGFMRLSLLLLLVFSLAGCKTVGGWFGDKEEPTETLPVEQLYAEAKLFMEDGKHERASRYYQRLVARFPYGPYTEQAQLELAYVLYKQDKFEDATSAIDRFIRTYPTHRHIDYAYYLKALINFGRSDSLLLRLARMDISARDLGAPTQSFHDFAEVVRRYPNSAYAADSRQRMIYLRNLLAQHERSVGLYYYQRGAYVSAINRGKYLIETYPQSEHEADAIALMAASYAALGQNDLATASRSVLERNYPEHPFLRGDWPKGDGILRKLNPFAGGQ
ncbi:MAG TPA: outer membrane protein assembly factor BamD [Arenimonas sp.]|nr:outer membrane protein assembly factor BamD [Arenimonas sp.]